MRSGLGVQRSKLLRQRIELAGKVMRIAGKLVDGQEQLEVFNPFSGKIVATVAAAKGSGLDRMRHAATELIGFPTTLAAAAVWSFKTVYNLAAKRSVGLRFDCKNLPSKCASLRFTCNRQQSI